MLERHLLTEECSIRKKKNGGAPKDNTGASGDCCGLSCRTGFLRGEGISTDPGGSEVSCVHCMGRSCPHRQEECEGPQKCKRVCEMRKKPGAEAAHRGDKGGQRLAVGELAGH